MWAKAGAMEHWDEIVTDRRLTLELAETHLERVVSQGPAYLLGHYQVVTSRGSSGDARRASAVVVLAARVWWTPTARARRGGTRGDLALRRDTVEVVRDTERVKPGFARAVLLHELAIHFRPPGGVAWRHGW